MSDDSYTFVPGKDIDGRPDWDNPRFGYTKAKRFKKFIYSNIGRDKPVLIHRVFKVEFCWYRGYFSWLKRLDHPYVYAETVCGYSFFLGPEKTSGIMTNRPDPEHPLCTKCARPALTRMC